MDAQAERNHDRTPITAERRLRIVPIPIDRFEDTDALREPRTSERIVRFLLLHDDQAFTRGELAEAVGSDPETVGTNLTRLKDRGVVRHHPPYWALASDLDQVRDALQSYVDESRLAEVFDGEDAGDSADGTAMHADDPATSSNGESSSADAKNPGRLETPDSLGAPEVRHRDAATAFSNRAQHSLGDAIDALYLFGSVARDTQTAGSDVDVLAVISDDADYASVDDRLLDIAYDVQLEYGVPVEVHVIRESEFKARRNRGEPFVRTVVREGELGV